MRQLFFVALFTGSLINSMAQDKNKYSLVWSDEFDHDGRPDSTKWGYEQGFVRNEEAQWYQAENAVCKNGILIIEAKREQKPNPVYSKTSKDWRKKRPL